MRSAHQAGIAIHVIDQVAQVVVLRRPFQPDASTPVATHLRHSCEDVLHPHSQTADAVVGLLLGFAQGMASRAFAHEELLRVELDEVLLVLRAVVGRVGEHGLVFFIEQFLKDLAVVHAGRSGFRFEDELGFQVGLHMVLVAVVRFVTLLGPAGVAVFLPAHGGVRVKLLGPLACFDLLVLLARVALARGFGEAGVDDAAFAGDEAAAFEMAAEGLEELAAAFTSVGLDALFEIPERFGIWDGVADAQSEEVFKAGAVKDLLLGGIRR